MEVEVDVIVQNTSKHDQTLDNIRFSIYDEDKNFQGDLTMDLAKVIPAGTTEEIEGRLNRIPKSSVFVAIDIGNATDLVARHLNKLHSIHAKLEQEDEKANAASADKDDVGKKVVLKGEQDESEDL